MSSFTEDLTVVKQKNGKWKVGKAFKYCLGYEDSYRYVKVEEGFETDFASVPRVFWSILPPDGQYTQAAVLHDFLYNTRKFWVDHILPGGKQADYPVDIRRRDCDDIFLEAMKVLGVALWKRQVMYLAVRAFGWIPWNKQKA